LPSTWSDDCSPTGSGTGKPVRTAYSTNQQLNKSTHNSSQFTQQRYAIPTPIRPIRLEENPLGQSSNHQIIKSTNPQITQTYQVGRKPVRTILKSSNHQIIKSTNHPDLSGWKKTC
jgi:hypothetical protein